MVRTNKEVNERRQRKSVGRSEKDLGGYGSAPSPITATVGPIAPINERAVGYMKIPYRDRSIRNNYHPGMWDLIRNHFDGGEPSLVLEVGSRRGAWASGLMERTKSTKVFCIDIWQRRQGRGNFHSWMKRMEDWAFRRAFPLMGPSARWAGLFPYKVDLAFIDADHSYVEARRDFSMWSQFVVPGGLLIGHDYQVDDVKLAANEVFEDKKIESAMFGTQRSMSFWVTI